MLFRSAEAFGGNEYSVEQIKVYLTLGQWILVVAMDEARQIHGAATLSFINYPNDRVAFITTMGGEEMCNDDALNQLRQILKSQGATKIQAACRESMVRLVQKIGFVSRYTVVETNI